MLSWSQDWYTGYRLGALKWVSRNETRVALVLCLYDGELTEFMTANPAVQGGLPGPSGRVLLTL